MKEPKSKHQKPASSLDEHLKTGVTSHDPALHAFEETSAALKREAQDASAKMDAGTARMQRTMLLNMAKRQENARKAEEGRAEVKEEKTRAVPVAMYRPWYAWAGGFVAALLVVAVLIGNLNGLPGKNGSLVALKEAKVAALLIPEAHAADAFSLMAETKDEAGVDPSTAFVVSSTVPVTANELMQHLALVASSEEGTDAASQPVAVEKMQDGRFRVKPTTALEPGKVYRIALATAVQKADGSLQDRDFSWAVQTKNDFRVLTSVPGNDTSYVPLNTGIEFTMSLTGWESPSSSFSISPKVDGYFETHGRSLAFVPKSPLKPGQLYTVTLKKGWKVAGSDLALASDYVVRFETQPEAARNDQEAQVWAESQLFTAAPNKESLVPVSLSRDAIANVAVTGYALEESDARAVLTEYARVPSFAYETRRRGDAFGAYAKREAFSFSASVEAQGYYKFLKLPASIGAGRYVVKLQPEGGRATWMYMEATNVATYVIADKEGLVVWAMDASSNRPTENAEVVLKSVSARTDAKGIARLPTPAEFNATSTPVSDVMTVRANGAESLVLLMPGATNVMPFYRLGLEGADQFVGYVYADRPIYRATDSAHVFALVQDRATKQKPSQSVTLNLRRNSLWDFFRNEQKVYRSVTLQPDESGFVRGDMDWSNLSAGYYSLVLEVNGREVASRSVEVRDFVKPAYSIDVKLDRESVFAGEDVTGEVLVTFFDGTPVPKMDLKLETYEPVRHQITLKTDESGRAKFRLNSNVKACSTGNLDMWCPVPWPMTITVSPVEGEEAQIYGSAWLQIWPARTDVAVDVDAKDGRAQIGFTTRRVDLSKAGANGRNVLAEPVSTQVTGRIVELSWLSIEDGTYYDPIQKKTMPRFRYEQKERDVANVNLTTGADGKASMPFTMADKVSYRVIVSVKDAKGATEVVQSSFAKDWGNGSERTGISLEMKNPQDDRAGFSVGEKVSLGLLEDGQPMPTTAVPNYLFVRTHLGIRETSVSTSPDYAFTFNEESVPNTRVRAIAFVKGGFVERMYDATFDPQERELKVSLSADQTSYAPGAKAKIHVKATRKDGRPASEARVGVSTVDEAVFVAAQDSSEEMPLPTLYGWVGEGVILVKESHFADPSEALRDTGAEGGGGGGETLRRNFKDTAAFATVTLDRNGEADVDIALPDNLTSWRVTAVAVTPDLFAGSVRAPLKVTRSVFVDVVAPGTMLVTDKPVLKLRSYGTALDEKERVTYVVNAPTLGLRNESVEGAAGTPAAISIPTLVEGEHVMTVQVTSSAGKDAIEKRIKIIPSRLTRDEFVSVDLAPGVSLPDAGVAREVEVSFLPKNRAQYLSETRMLAEPWSQRFESRFAANLARTMLKDQFGSKEAFDPSESLSRYQQDDGGIAILPYASSDLELSSKVAAIAPDQVDRVLLANYFWEVVQKKDASRERQIQALSGLAALGEPALEQLHDMARRSDLSWREQLAVIRGLDAAGDREAARGLLNQLLSKAQNQDGKLMLRVAEDKSSILAATIEAAGVASSVADPSAEALHAWVEANWAEDVLTDLDRIAYLRRAVPASLNRDVTVGYSTGGAEEALRLVGGQAEIRTFTADELKALRITKVDGPAAAVYVRRVAGAARTNTDVSVKRTYLKKDGTPATQIADGDPVTVQIETAWRDAAPSGCYVVRDPLPAGLAPMVSVGLDYAATDSWYPAEVDDNVVSFVTCKPEARASVRSSVLKYSARVITRGAYTAEPTLVQSMSSPSVASMGTAQTMEIK